MGFRPVVVAAPGTPCGWTANSGREVCGSGKPAVHVLTATLPVAAEGTALCGFHSPYDPTDAEREACGVPLRTNAQAGAQRLAVMAEHKAMMGRAAVVVRAEQAVRAFKLSVPMVGVLKMVADSRGTVGAWAMVNVVTDEVPGATKATLRALIRRGLLEAVTNDGNQSGTDGLTDYVLTEAGLMAVEALGFPVVTLPTDEAEIAALIASASREDCSCDVISDRGSALLPVGGDVCLGCGSTFMRPNGQLHPALFDISVAVVGRNLSKGV